MDVHFKASELKKGKIDNSSFTAAYLMSIKAEHPDIFKEFCAMVDQANFG